MQVGEATTTVLRAFTVCGEGQLHDLHSKLHLDHPEGQANQLHKWVPLLKFLLSAFTSNHDCYLTSLRSGLFAFTPNHDRCCLLACMSAALDILSLL